jgi:hypothetical protein
MDQGRGVIGEKRPGKKAGDSHRVYVKVRYQLVQRNVTAKPECTAQFGEDKINGSGQVLRQFATNYNFKICNTYLRRKALMLSKIFSSYYLIHFSCLCLIALRIGTLPMLKTMRTLYDCSHKHLS